MKILDEHVLRIRGGGPTQIATPGRDLGFLFSSHEIPSIHYHNNIWDLTLQRHALQG